MIMGFRVIQTLISLKINAGFYETCDKASHKNAAAGKRVFKYLINFTIIESDTSNNVAGFT